MSQGFRRFAGTLRLAGGTERGGGVQIVGGEFEPADEIIEKYRVGYGVVFLRLAQKFQCLAILRVIGANGRGETTGAVVLRHHAGDREPEPQPVLVEPLGDFFQQADRFQGRLNAFRPGRVREEILIRGFRRLGRVPRGPRQVVNGRVEIADGPVSRVEPAPTGAAKFSHQLVQ